MDGKLGSLLNSDRQISSGLLDASALSYLCNLVKFAKQLIQHVYEFAWRTVTGQSGESHNICIENAVENKQKERSTGKTAELLKL